MNIETRQVPFFHVELSGSAYQAGQMQGQMIRSIPGWLDFNRSGRGAFNSAEFHHIYRLCDRYCPGLNEEIQGMADVAQITPEEVIYYANTYLRTPRAMPGNCSHFVLLPSRTTGGHVLAARSYEYGDKADDLRLCTTRLDGRYAHIGSSTMLFGRAEGINEQGLSVTCSAGGMPVGPMRPAIQDGFQFWALVRAILETCRSVDEALDLIAEFPLASNPILILADRSANAALVELHGAVQAVRRIDPGSSESFLCATNHYILPELDSYQPARMAHSLVRRDAITRFLAQEGPLDKAQICRFLSEPYPAGPTCHYYDEFFGTLRSMLFDLTAGSLDVCFGSPAANPWHSLNFTTSPSPAPYLACLPLEHADPGFWAI